MKWAEILDVEETDDGFSIDLEYEVDEGGVPPDVVGISWNDILDAIEQKRADSAELKLLWLLSVATRKKA